MLVTIRGKRWHLIFTKVRGAKGECDRPDKKGKQIRVAPNLSERKTLEMLLHEFLHGADWDKDEEWVDEVSRDLERFLTRLGYRREQR